MSLPLNILDLPNEILHLIAQHLDAFSIVWLQRSCRGFRELIPPPTHPELIRAETTAFGFHKDLYACGHCRRLRPRTEFADNMVKSKKAKFEPKAGDRWCVECGIKTGPGINRYAPGHHVVILKKLYVICKDCRTFGEGASEDGKNLSVCKVCRRRNIRIMEEYRERQALARRRAEQVARRARRRALWGDSASDSDDMMPPSPTWSEEQMDIVQAEASRYMNSPGPGSD
ncbi:hypothetical protein N7451_007526 [Penicillium sp. IBT 35674x]|nr:hypothetical protein N7451_007526 [Penicillium sp. IBT 35674x]